MCFWGKQDKMLRIAARKPSLTHRYPETRAICRHVYRWCSAEIISMELRIIVNNKRTCFVGWSARFSLRACGEAPVARGGGRGHLRLLTGAGAGGGGRTCFFSPLPVLRSIFSVNGGWICAHGDQNRQHSEDLPEPPVRQRPWEAAGQRRRPCSSRRRKEEPCRGRSELWFVCYFRPKNPFLLVWGI